MFKRIYWAIPRRVRILIIFILILFLSYFVLRFFAIEPRVIPEDFLKARQEASAIAAEIVAFSNESANNIARVARLDHEQRYEEAFALLSQEVDRNALLRDRASNLSARLEIMANSIERISPASLSQVALQAVSSETTLISHLIAYNDYLAQLLTVLERKFSGDETTNTIAQLLIKINKEVYEIDALNEKFNAYMKQFDEMQ